MTPGHVLTAPPHSGAIAGHSVARGFGGSFGPRLEQLALETQAAAVTALGITDVIVVLVAVHEGEDGIRGFDPLPSTLPGERLLRWWQHRQQFMQQWMCHRVHGAIPPATSSPATDHADATASRTEGATSAANISTWRTASWEGQKTYAVMPTSVLSHVSVSTHREAGPTKASSDRPSVMYPMT